MAKKERRETVIDKIKGKELHNLFVEAAKTKSKTAACKSIEKETNLVCNTSILYKFYAENNFKLPTFQTGEFGNRKNLSVEAKIVKSKDNNIHLPAALFEELENSGVDFKAILTSKKTKVSIEPK